MEEHKILRDAIKYENELINNRLTWLGTLEGLLFATLGLAYDKIKPNFYLISVISLLGALIAVSCWIGTLRANKVINYYEKKQEKFPGDLLSQDVVKNNKGYFYWMMPGYAIPFMFIVAWLGILLSLKCLVV